MSVIFRYVFMDHKVLNEWCKKKYYSHFKHHKLITPIPHDLIIIDYRDIILNRKNCTLVHYLINPLENFSSTLRTKNYII